MLNMRNIMLQTFLRWSLHSVLHVCWAGGGGVGKELSKGSSFFSSLIGFACFELALTIFQWAQALLVPLGLVLNHSVGLMVSHLIHV